MSIIFDNPPPAIGCGDPGDPIDFGCLFNGAEYLSRVTPANTGGTKFTFSCWIKRWKLGEPQMIYSDGAYSQSTVVYFASDDTLRIDLGNGSVNHSLVASGLRRDIASHAHIKLDIDTSQPTATARVILKINGLVVPLSGSFPPQNFTGWMAAGSNMAIGYNTGGTSNWFLKSLCSEVILVVNANRPDSDFGYFNTDGVWVHKAFSGKGQGVAAYGVNGFHHDFSDPLDLGKDVSGNGNHFTSVGLTADNQEADTPKNNIARLNPLSPGASACLKAGNTLIDGLVNQTNEAACTQIIPPDASGRWTARFRIDVYGNSSDDRSGTYTCPETGTSYSFKNLSSQELIFRPGDISLGYINQGDEIDFTLDFDADTIELVSNGVLLHTVPNANLGQGHWLYSAKAESTLSRSPADISVWFDAVEGEEFSATRLPCPDILNPDDYFTTRQPIGGADISDLPWDPTVHKTLCLSKRRDSETDWRASDTVRGDNLAWSSNVGGLETACSLSFTPSGITAGADTEYQGSRIDYFWRASPKSGFDIVDFTHVNGTPTTIAHAAGGVIEFALVVPLDGGDIRVFHHSLPAGGHYTLNSVNPYSTDAGWFSGNANTLSLGATMPAGRYIAYVWRSVPQFSAFPSWSGNQAPDGPHIPADFTPRLFMPALASANTFNRDLIYSDGSEGNPVSSFVYLNAPSIEGTSGHETDFVSSGVKLRTASTEVNPAVPMIGALWASTAGKFARAQ